MAGAFFVIFVCRNRKRERGGIGDSSPDLTYVVGTVVKYACESEGLSCVRCVLKDLVYCNFT